MADSYEPKKQPMNGKLKHREKTEKIIGAALEVHRFLGNGFQEVICQRVLALELARVGLTFAREIEQDILYRVSGAYRDSQSRFCG